jgi:hypothetical protein
LNGLIRKKIQRQRSRSARGFKFLLALKKSLRLCVFA